MISKNLKTAPLAEPNQSISMVRRFLRSQIVLIELVLLGYALGLLQQANASAQMFVATALFFAAMFTLITGKGFAHFRHRGKALLIVLLSGFFMVSGAVVFDREREAHLLELREADPAVYLKELREIDDERWLTALKEIDPKAYAREVARRLVHAEMQRLDACSEESVDMAYIMIQTDVKNQLRAPSTAEFPRRYRVGSGYLGECIFQVVGTFDAQNGFGAMLRGAFIGTIQYFPERGSWKTQSLSVN